MRDEKTLKPCPFCGNDEISVDSNAMDDSWFWIQCLECKASIGHKRTERGAVKAWNRRVMPRVSVETVKSGEA